MTPSETRFYAVTMLTGIKMNPDPEEQVKMVTNTMRSVASRSMKAGLAIGIGATLIVGIIAMLLLGLCNHIHLPLG